jgi:leucyl aminopeptidase
MFLDISQDEMRERLEKFSSFFNRYYKSEYGKESSEWLLSQAEYVKAASQCLDHLEINRFEHSGWPQISVIAKFHGKDDAKKKEVVVLSAHLDSTAGFYGMYNRAPGADDNGK